MATLVQPELNAESLGRLAAMLHNLVLEVAAMNERLARIEARLDGKPAPTPAETRAIATDAVERLTAV